MRTPDISVVIITWNQRNLLEQCIDSISRQSWNADTELIVVDNDSTDDTASYLSGLSGCRVILNDRNEGVARARNQGIKAASGRYILHLDDDTIVHEGCLDRIVDFLDRYQEVWLCGGKLLNCDGSLQPSARNFYDIPAILARRTAWGRTSAGKKTVDRHLLSDWDHMDNRTVDWVCGACFCMRKTAVDQIGGLDDGYFFGFEDVDWAWRVWSSGGMVAYIHDALVTHHYQRSSAKLFSRKALSHLASLFRFHLRHGFSLPERPHEQGVNHILQ